MSLLRKGYTVSGKSMPERCLAFCYFEGETAAKVFTRDGDTWRQIKSWDDEKWKAFTPSEADASTIMKASGAKEVDFFELKPEAQAHKGESFTA